MDASLLTSDAFWQDPRPFAAREIPDIPELGSHVLFETSGSSGAPKWVALSKPALLASAAAVNANLNVTGVSCWGLALPVNHVGGFGILARNYQAGCRSAVLIGKWNPHGFHRWVHDSGVTHTSLVPTQVHDLVKAGLRPPPNLSAIVVGGGQLDSPTGQAARYLGWPVLASYGMTEAGSQIATQGLEALAAPYQPSPIPVLPLWKARVSGEGLLEISGEALFSGYLSGNTFFPRSGIWHTTSDRVTLRDGLLTPLGRADLLIKVLGELVDPEAIEREMVSISNGALASGTFAVIGIPDDRAGNVLLPVFEFQVDRDLIESTVSSYNQGAPGFRRLKPAVTIDALPRTELGKLGRAELAATYQEKHLE
ncbi:MAG: AMP-binding protein [Verrucomicrobiota bacterium]